MCLDQRLVRKTTRFLCSKVVISLVFNWLLSIFDHVREGIMDDEPFHVTRNYPKGPETKLRTNQE